MTDKVEGYLVNPENIEEIIHRIKELLSSHKLRDTMASNAYKRVQDTFCSGIVVDELEQFYSSL